MMNGRVLEVFSWCFAPVARSLWEDATCARSWGEHVAYLRRYVDGDARLALSLERFSQPPDYEEKARFAARHFTGGLPGSALPVESLYAMSSSGVLSGEYLQPSALYMRDLVASLGLQVPADFAACPDHLALELEVAALLAEGDLSAARDFVSHRFTWLGAYSARLRSVDADASFYLAALDVLACVIDAWREGA